MSEAQKKIVTVGKNGQISVGMEFAGRILEIAYLDDGRVLLSPGQFVPDHQEAFFTAAAEEKLRAFGAWEKEHPPIETDIEELRKVRPKKRAMPKSGA